MEHKQPALKPEEIARHYSAAMDSVNLINRLLAIVDKTEDDLDTIKRNAQHLQIMLLKDYWTTEDLTPFSNAVNLSNV